MAHNSHTTCTFFLIALIMFATAKPLAHGWLSNFGNGQGSAFDAIIGGIFSFLGLLFEPLVPISSVLLPLQNSVLPTLVQGLTFNGLLCCTPTLNCPATGGQPLSGALIRLNCTTNRFAGGTLVLGPARIDINGYFNISVTNLLDTINNIPPVVLCNMTVNLDQAICPVISTAEVILTAVVMQGSVRIITKLR